VGSQRFSINWIQHNFLGLNLSHNYACLCADQLKSAWLKGFCYSRWDGRWTQTNSDRKHCFWIIQTNLGIPSLSNLFYFPNTARLKIKSCKLPWPNFFNVSTPTFITKSDILKTISKQMFQLQVAFFKEKYVPQYYLLTFD